LAAAATDLFCRCLQTQSKPVRDPYRDALSDKRNDFTRRIKGAEKEKILEKFKTLRKLTPDELTMFKYGLWTQPVFKDPDWPYLALRAYLDGDLDSSQAAKLFLFERVLGDGIVKEEIDDGDLVTRIASPTGETRGTVHQFFDHEGKPDPISRKLLQQGLKADSGRMFGIMQQVCHLPPEETQFFLIDAAPLLTKNQVEYNQVLGSVDLYNASLIAFEGTAPLLIIDEERRIIQLLVLPPRLYHALLKGKFGPNAMAPNPILGYAAVERMSDIEKRVQCIPSSLAALPSMIHQIIDAEDPLAVYFHDQLHLFIESGNPIRQLWTDLALSFKQSDPELCTILLDRNYPLYSFPELRGKVVGSDDVSPDEIFWYSFPVLQYFEPDTWTPERIDAVLRHLVKLGVSLDPLLKIAANEKPNHPYALAPWAKAARNLLSSAQKPVVESSSQ